MDSQNYMNNAEYNVEYYSHYMKECADAIRMAEQYKNNEKLLKMYEDEYGRSEGLRKLQKENEEKLADAIRSVLLYICPWHYEIF